jgi:NitT/TauT family transport system permease protein
MSDTITSPPPETPVAPVELPPTLAKRRVERGRIHRFLVAFAFFAGLVVVWHVVVSSLPPVYRLVTPPPLKVWSYLVGAVKSGDLFIALRVTMSRLMIGYLAGVAIGVPLGILTARFRWAQDTLGVLGLGLQTLPSVCWVPLALLWFHQTEGAMLFVVIMGTVWSVQLAVASGVRNVPPIYARAARTMGSNGLHIWVTVILPASLPFIVSGVKQGWAFAWRSLMAAELYVTILTGFGLGQLLNYGRDLGAMEQVIGIMLVIILIGVLADKILFSPWERFLYRRWGTTKS